MTDKNIKAKIDKAIKEVWLEEIKEDYLSDHLLLEDSLKCSLYYHLRQKLSDRWLERNNIRIFPEYHLENNCRADIAIVKLYDKRDGKHLSKCEDTVIAIIELKYKGCTDKKPFLNDCNKLEKYVDDYPNSQLYAGFIHEKGHDINNLTWFTKENDVFWTKGRLTELLGTWIHDGERNYQIRVKSYNNMNTHLDCVEAC